MVFRVFVSSRTDELTEERNLARKTIEELKLEPLMLELLPQSTPKDVEEAYLDGVRLCDVYVGIIGAEGSPPSLQEFQEAVKLEKKCLMFAKRVPQRQPGADEFLDQASKFNCAEYSEPQEFSSQLEKSLLTLVAGETLRRLETISQSRQNFTRTYLEDYVRPVLDEVREIEHSLIDKRFDRLPTDAWDTAGRSRLLGTDSDLDQRIAELYSRVRNLNDLRNAAIEAHRQDVISIMHEAFLEGARSLNEYITIERVLTENFEFFLTPDADAYSELAKPILDQLDGPVKSIMPKHLSAPYVSALWLVNKMLQRAKLRPLLEERRILNTKGWVQYRDAFSALHPQARRICEILLQIYEGKIQV